MNKGSGGKEYPYYRVTVNGRGAIIPDGSNWPHDKSKTHTKFTDNYVQEIKRLVYILKRIGCEQQVVEVREELNKLWGGVIDKFKFDLNKHSIEMEIRIIEENKISRYQLTIGGITSFYYNDPGSYFNNVDAPPNWDYAELSEVSYDKKKLYKVVLKSKDENQNGEMFFPNIIMEIWNNSFMVKGKSIEINNKFYRLD